MYHDFNDTSMTYQPRQDPFDNSKKCYGYMDYLTKTHGWSNCSVSDMNRYLANNCLEPIDGPNPTSSPSLDQYCLEVRPRPSWLGQVPLIPTQLPSKPGPFPPGPVPPGTFPPGPFPPGSGSGPGPFPPGSGPGAFPPGTGSGPGPFPPGPGSVSGPFPPGAMPFCVGPVGSEPVWAGQQPLWPGQGPINTGSLVPPHKGH